jgi:competence protein ComEC
MVMAGMEAPVVRATVMVLLVWSARLSGRKTSSLWVLLITALCMVVFSPGILFSLSFQLSVAATTGIILFSEPFEVFSVRLSRLSPVGGWVLGVAGQTLAAQVCILPLLMHYFGRTNFISVVANGAVAWLVAPLVIGGMAVAGLYIAFPFLAELAAIPLELLLRFLVYVGEWAAASEKTAVSYDLTWHAAIGYWVLVAFLYHRINKIKGIWAGNF